jgi:prephenate dehydrogenase
MDNEIPAEIRTAAIVGLGLIGGSVARDLAARGVRVLAWDADGESLRAAVDAGAVHHPLTGDLRDVDQADVVVLAVPVLAAPGVLRALAPHLAGVPLVTDVGSTKTSIVHAAESLGLGARFVGSHPLAGDHRSGWSASRTGLLADARVYLCPTASTTDDAMRLARALWTMVDARPEAVGAAEHDRRLAWTSHLPQMVSSALGGALAGQGIGRGDLGPGGRDVTRLAGSSPEMWADIARDNAGALIPAIEAAEAQLRLIRGCIENGDHARLLEVLANARAWHQQSP